MRTGLRVLLFFGVLALVPQERITVVCGGDRPKGSVVSREESEQSASITYEWRNPNPGTVTGANSMSFTCGATIPLDRVRAAIESFGIDESVFQFSFTSATDRKRKEQQMQDLMAARGMEFDKSTNVAKISYNWMVEKSQDDVKAGAAALEKLGVEKGFTGAREMLGVFVSFVQSIEFRVPETYRQNAKGERVFTGGVRMPQETLYNGWGDCDTKCVLFASLLSNVPKTSVVFLVGKKHMFVGIHATPRSNDRFIEIRGIPYVLAEMTTPWPLGRIPEDNWIALDQNLFRIVEIYSNN